MDTGQTIFTLFSGVLMKLGITEAWMNAATVNVMMLLALVKPKFPSIDNWKEESALVAVLTAALAAAQFYGNPWAIPVAVVLVWFGVTFVPKGGAATIDTTHKALGGPRTDVKPGGGE